MNKSEAIDTWMWLQNAYYSPEMVSVLQEQADNLVMAKCKELTRKNKKTGSDAWNYVVKNIENGESILVELVSGLKKISLQRYDDFKFQKENAEKELKEFAKSYPPEISNNMNCVKFESISSWHTQGWGASKYAKNALMDDYNLLQLLGYQVKIRYSQQTEMYNDSWQLWTNLNQFNFDMLKKSGRFISLLNWCVIHWQNGTNPKCYFPFISNDDYEKSQVLAYKTDYKVTVENMMKELSWDEINQLRTS